jgi:hypothetical protein
VIRCRAAARDQQFGQRDTHGQAKAVAIKMCPPDRIELVQPRKQVLLMAFGCARVSVWKKW